MGTRLELQTLLEHKLGTKNVYFQPPESIKINYPAVVYNLTKIDTKKADDINYKSKRLYSLQYISRDPDNSFIDDILEYPYCKYDRRFVFDNLYHDCFNLFF